ncbi:bifunctional nuclease family protein [Nitrospira moscoviensis]|uniref:BFN domain-containing protein n=1 Tax=Nitrospira moscoviensis TaxID=42253 RepID=A0A0K2GGL2_NITMO|nr:bifunctional nuclease family protein [Nitrospira moscoviensis]ALA60100.1 conserved exported protein of unknown function [Nitrospira moscoviensis]
MTHVGRLMLGVVILSVLLSSRLSLSQQPPPPAPNQVTVSDVKVRMSDHGPVVLLQAEDKTLPIFVDMTVALSIQSALSGERLARPLSHDLMRTILDAYGGKVLQTVITRKDGTYYGALTVAVKDQVKTFDSRSSDSIALAIHFKAPIVVARDLFDSAAKLPEKGKGAEL